MNVKPTLGERATSDRSKSEGSQDAPITSYYVEVFLKSVSAAVAAAGTPGPLAMLEEAAGRSADFEARITQALDLDIAASLGEAKEARSTRYAPVVRLLKAWAKKSGDSRKVLIDHMVDATLDPLTWRVALEDVGPRPKVSVVLFVPGSYPHTSPSASLHDFDVAVVYRGALRAAEEIDDLAAAMTPDVSVPTPPVVLQARRNAQARTALLGEFGGLTATQVAELAGSGAKNTSALAGRWRREGRLVAVEHQGTTYYPGFQFDASGKPKTVIADVLEHLSHPSMTPWQQALWFTSANGWLNGRRPVDVLDEHPEAVVAAAREALREPVG